MLFAKGFGKENRKEFGKKKRKGEALPVGLAAQPAPGPARSRPSGQARARSAPSPSSLLADILGPHVSASISFLCS